MRESNPLQKVLLGAVLAVVAGMSAGLQAQTGGDNAVYNAAGSTTPVTSTAIIDASPFASKTITFCETIYSILSSASGRVTYPTTGAIIDARGLSSNNTNMTCGANESPWSNTAGVYLPKPSVLLLPAGVITISFTWQLPNQTRLIGQGAVLPGQSGGTQIQASTTTTFQGLGETGIPTTMIQFGDPTSTACGTGICFDISVQDLTLNGSNQVDSGSNAIDGIINLNSQELTYVRRVNLYQITGTGLQVGNPENATQAQNSGPYEQIYFTAGTHTGVIPVCAQIYSEDPVRGIRGIRCEGASTQIAGGAIKLDAFANSLTDVYIDGFHDGVLIGSQINGTPKVPGVGSANVLRNISGSSNVTNLIHICNPGNAISYCNASSTKPTIADVTIMGVAASGNTGTLSIEDDMTGANLGDANIAMYVLGESMSGGITRFTTSKSVPTWFVGTGNPTGKACSGPMNGSLFSSTTQVSTKGPLWVCANGTWAQVN